jgi:hypothetical protein
MTAPLPATWRELAPLEAASLESELRRELSPTHCLSNRMLRAIARRDGYDDVLFAPASGHAPVYCVHLTWSVETDPAWPWTNEYRDQAEFAKRWPRENADDEVEDAG